MADLRRLASRVRRWLKPLGPAPTILMYHRIAEPIWDPWELSVSPKHFDEQLAFLQRSRTVLSMAAFTHALVHGSLPADAVALTFDDGYRDNLQAARPLLYTHGVPATVCLATAFIGCDEAFWWDELAERLLPLPEGPLQIDALAMSSLLPPLERDDKPAWRAESGATTVRQQHFLRVWRQCRAMPPSRRGDVLSELRASLGPSPAAADAVPMSVEEIHALIADGLITVAAHTVSHPALSELDALDYRREIAESAAWCAQFGDAFSGGFAYPYGDCSAAVRAAVAESGLRWAASTQRRSANGATLFDLPRLAVGNWGADDLARAMRFS